MVERLSVSSQIAKNQAKSMILMGIIIAAFIILGYLISFFLDPSYFFIVMAISIVVSLAYTLFSYYNSHNIALSSVRARPASKEHYRQLHDSVRKIASSAGLPMPKLYIMNSSEINAFASGRNPQNAVVCVTTGCLEKLSKEELEGVLAHEMAHVANYDIRFMTLATVMIGMIGIAAEILMRSFWFSDDEGRGGIIAIVASILVAILAPLLAQLIAFAISRRREFVADALGAKFTQNPKGLANALRKIKHEHVPAQEMAKYPREVAPLFISDPFKKQLRNLFSTHPNIDDRIKILESM